MKDIFAVELAEEFNEKPQMLTHIKRKELLIFNLSLIKILQMVMTCFKNLSKMMTNYIFAF